MPTRPPHNKPGNRKLIAFFKFIIVSTLVVPWLIAGLVALNFYNSVLNFNGDIGELENRIELLTNEKEGMQVKIEDGERMLIEITEEKEALQRSARDTSNDPENFDYSAELHNSPNSSNGGDLAATEDNATTLNRSQIDELARQVIIGNWGNGLARVLSLSDAGYNHATIQQRVNEIIWGN